MCDALRNRNVLQVYATRLATRLLSQYTKLVVLCGTGPTAALVISTAKRSQFALVTRRIVQCSQVLSITACSGEAERIVSRPLPDNLPSCIKTMKQNCRIAKSDT